MRGVSSCSGGEESCMHGVNSCAWGAFCAQCVQLHMGVGVLVHV